MRPISVLLTMIFELLVGLIFGMSLIVAAVVFVPVFVVLKAFGWREGDVEAGDDW